MSDTNREDAPEPSVAPEIQLLGGNVQATGLSLSSTERGTTSELRKLALTRLDVDGVEGTLGDVSYRVAEISLDGLAATLGQGQITSEGADLSGLSLLGPGYRIEIRRCSCPSGLLTAGAREWIAPHVSFEDVRVVIDDLSSLLARRSESTSNTDSQVDSTLDSTTDSSQSQSASPSPAGVSPSPAGVSPSSAGVSPIDLHCLDALHGQLDIDLAVDMTLPWVGRRRVTHYFRVPIDHGTIDYERLEDDVHWLEATFLTIAQIEDRLVLARDLPLMPISGKTLLWWQLEPADIPVADLRRVHLRNLVRPRVAERSRKRDKGKSKLLLHALAMQNIKLALHTDTPVQLGLPGGAMLQLGDDDSAGLAGLTLEGELRYARPNLEATDVSQKSVTPNSDPAESADRPDQRTSLRGSVALLDMTLNDLALGKATISVDRLHIGSLEQIELWFDGFRPDRLELSIGRMAATNVRVTTSS